MSSGSGVPHDNTHSPSYLIPACYARWRHIPKTADSTGVVLLSVQFHFVRDGSRGRSPSNGGHHGVLDARNWRASVFASRRRRDETATGTQRPKASPRNGDIAHMSKPRSSLLAGFWPEQMAKGKDHVCRKTIHSILRSSYLPIFIPTHFSTLTTLGTGCAVKRCL